MAVKLDSVMWHLQHLWVAPFSKTEFINQFILIQDLQQTVFEHFNVCLQLWEAAGKENVFTLKVRDQSSAFLPESYQTYQDLSDKELYNMFE